LAVSKKELRSTYVISLKADRARYVLSDLSARYPDPTPPLQHQDEFTLLIAVLLSAQTTDARVNLVTPSLFQEADTPEAMVKLGADGILKHIRTCGLAPTKAKNIARLSQIIVDKHNSIVPRTFEELEALPGVGHKTASVVMAACFHVPAFPVDTHIHRLAKRWRLSSGKNVETTEKDLKRIFPESSWNSLHLQIIFYGREHCTARGCDGSKCPICRTLNGRA
jgi:endonuclease III